MTPTQTKLYLLAMFMFGWSAAPFLGKHPFVGFMTGALGASACIALTIRSIKEQLENADKDD